MPGLMCGLSFPALFALLLVLLSMHDVHGLHDETKVCAPTTMEVSCSPSTEIVTSDGSPANEEFRFCSPRFCTDMPMVEHATVNALGGEQVVAIGDAVGISCNTGYEIDVGEGTYAQPICTDGCTFQKPASCAPVKCTQAFADPFGVVNGGPMNVLADRSTTYLEYDEYVRITCNHGYMASDSSHTSQEPCKVSYVRECLHDGTLSHSATECVPLKCMHITSDPSYGTYLPAAAINYNDTVSLTCNTGYFPSGGSPVRHCAWTCQFTTAHGQCSPTSCNTTRIPDKTHWVGNKPNLWSETGVLECANQHVFDLETCATTASLTCNNKSNSALTSAVFHPPVASLRCKPAKCKMSTLNVSNSDRASAGAVGDVRAHSAEVSVMCDDGYRAVSGNVHVLCSHPRHFNTTCGKGALDDSTYAPCGWNISLECKPVKCPVAPLANGVRSVNKGVIAPDGGQDYMEFGATLTMTCNAGYGLTRNDAALFVLTSAAKTTEFSCDAFCNSTVFYCKPVLCGDYTVPNVSTANHHPTGAGGSSVTPYSANTLISNITYPGTVTVTCDSTYVSSLAGSNTCANEYVLTCGDNGAFTPPAGTDMTCVAAECSVNELSVSDSTKSPASGGLNHGQIANVTCNSLYRVKPSSYSQPYARCDHGKGYSRTCNGATCSFAGQNEVCAPMGCYGMEAYNTTDTLHPVRFSTDGVCNNNCVTSIKAGNIKAAANNPLHIHCPTGYRIHPTEPSTAVMPKTYTHNHCTPSDNCTLNRFEPVHCSRLTCGNFSMPNMSASGVRDSVAFARASIVQNVLYDESMHVTCDAYHHLTATGLTPGCLVRNFTVECGDDGDLLYRLSDGTTSTSVPMCVPVTCNLADISVSNAGYLSSGYVAAGGKANVTCNAGFRKSEATTQYTNCSNDASFVLTCQDSTCQFSAPPNCKEISCNGLSGNDLTTADGLLDLSFSYDGDAISKADMPSGLKVPVGSAGEGLVVTCPDGYRVWPANSASPNPTHSEPKSQTIRCTAHNCTLPSVRCVRLTCGSSRMVLNGDGTRSTASPFAVTTSPVTANGTIDNILYAETIQATCETDFWLTEGKVCSAAQNFSYKCGDDEVNSDSGLGYLNGLSSSINAMGMQCRAKTCDVADVGAANGVRYPSSATVRSTQKTNVSCNDGYLVKPQHVTRHPICGDAASFELTCSGCEFPQVIPSCQKRGCLGTALNRTHDGLLPVTYSYAGVTLTQDISDGQYMVGDDVKVQCPVGYRVPATDNEGATRATDARHNMSMCASDACGLSPVTCRRLTCGNLSIPPNSTGAFKGDTGLVAGSLGYMMWNDTLTVTCEDQHILSTSDIDECAYSYKVRCNDNGAFESNVPMDSVKCILAQKRVECATCRKTWGVGPEEGDPKFPDSPAKLDCSVGHCDPPHGNDSYVTHAVVPGDRCQIERGATTAQCLHVQCRPLPVPYLAERIEIHGQSYEASALGVYPVTLCGEVVQVFCAADHAPEKMVNSASNCTHASFNMTCDSRGFWTGYQKCVPKACVMTEEHMSFVVAPGESYDKPCSLTTEIARQQSIVNGIMVTAPLPVCQSNCQLNVIERCVPWNCSAYLPGLYVDNTTAIPARSYGLSTTVRCADGYAATTPGVAGCTQHFNPMCKPDKSFSHQSGQQCFPETCPAYHQVAQNIKVTAHTAMPTSIGQAISVQCKDEYANGMGYGFNQAGIAHSRYTIRGQAPIASVTCEAACTWADIHDCVAVPCKCMTFADFSQTLSSPTDGTINPVLLASESDGTMEPLQTKRLQCPVGYEMEGPAGILTCQNDCALRISGTRCVLKQCKWSDMRFLNQVGVKASPANDARMLVGEKATVECDPGYELTMQLPRVPEPIIMKAVIGLESLGNVRIFAEKTFPMPDSTKDVSYALDGDFSSVKLELPAGAWPEGLAEGPSMTVFQMPPRNASAGIDVKKVAGKAINFGPSGIKFTKPVTLYLPLDLDGLDLGGLVLQPHRYNPADGSWTAIPFPSGYQVPSFPTCGGNSSNTSNASACASSGPASVIKGATLSFSAYAALAVPPPPPPPTLAPTMVEGEEGKTGNYITTIIIGVCAGLLVCLALGLMIRYLRKNTEAAHAKHEPQNNVLRPLVTDMGEAKTLSTHDELISPIFPASAPQVVSARGLMDRDSRDIQLQVDERGPLVTPRVTSDSAPFLSQDLLPVEHEGAPQPPPRTSIAGYTYGMNPDPAQLSVESQQRLGSMSSKQSQDYEESDKWGNAAADATTPLSPAQYKRYSPSSIPSGDAPSYRAPPPPELPDRMEPRGLPYAQYVQLGPSPPTSSFAPVEGGGGSSTKGNVAMRGAEGVDAVSASGLDAVNADVFDYNAGLGEA